jgi:hypothetical protein
MEQYVLYEKPKDYPTKYVVRKWIIESGKDIKAVGVEGTFATEDLARDHMDQHDLAFLYRCPEDDPVILGVWI